MTSYVENSQFDAEECMTYVINLFYPRIDNINHSDHNKGLGESVLLFNCNKQSNKLYRTALYQFEFPEPDVQNFVQLKMKHMTIDEYVM